MTPRKGADDYNAALSGGSVKKSFARWVFGIAGLYGIIILAPMLLLERQMAPGAVHPVFFYAWVSVGLAWQILFIVLSMNPVRYRPMMLVCVLQKMTAGSVTRAQGTPQAGPPLIRSDVSPIKKQIGGVP